MTTLRTRLAQLERAAADAGLEPPCPGCDYPFSSVPTLVVESDDLKRLGRCPECKRPLDLEGRPVTHSVVVLEDTQDHYATPFPPKVVEALAKSKRPIEEEMELDLQEDAARDAGADWIEGLD